jgi:hypothetical protein
MRSKIKLSDYPNIANLVTCVGDIGIKLSSGNGARIGVADTTTSRIIYTHNYAIHVNTVTGEIKKIIQYDGRAETTHTKQKHIKRILDVVASNFKGAEVTYRLGILL